MAGMDPGSEDYQAISGAAAALNHVISQDAPGQSEVASAMAALTQAMAGVY